MCQHRGLVLAERPESRAQWRRCSRVDGRRCDPSCNDQHSRDVCLVGNEQRDHRALSKSARSAILRRWLVWWRGVSRLPFRWFHRRSWVLAVNVDHCRNASLPGKIFWTWRFTPSPFQSGLTPLSAVEGSVIPADLTWGYHFFFLMCVLLMD